ncbi:MAG: chromatin protein Cren7 [Candidatus Bathycorpusculaceae bacterium]
MAKCPKCGKEVSTPKKTWKMAGRKDKSGKRYGFTIGLFEHCGKTFRSVLGKRKI